MGRLKGSVNKNTLAERRRNARAVAAGITPVEYLLGIMRDENEKQDKRIDAAKAVAPYLHARLQATTIKEEPPDKPIGSADERLLKLAKAG